jgi:uroporphyrinogen III methyltransferase/synthase
MMPLEGWRVVVTRSREQGSALGSALAESGAIPIYVPAVVISHHAPDRALLARVRDLNPGDLLVFTSVNGVEAYHALRQAAGMSRISPQVSIAAVGPATGAALAARGAANVLQPEEHSSQGLAMALPPGEGRRAVLPRGSLAGDELPALLVARGYVVNQIEVYETRPAEGDPESCATLASADAISFLSGSAVDGIVAMIDGNVVRESVLAIVAACIGDSTAQAAARAGFGNRLVAPRATVAALAGALADYAATRVVGGYS